MSLDCSTSALFQSYAIFAVYLGLSSFLTSSRCSKVIVINSLVNIFLESENLHDPYMFDKAQPSKAKEPCS